MIAKHYSKYCDNNCGNQDKQNPKDFKKLFIIILDNSTDYYLFAGDFARAEQYATEGFIEDNSQIRMYLNCIAAILLQGKYTEAENLYRTNKAQLKDAFLESLKQLEDAGMIPDERREDVEKIRTLLNE